VVDVSQKWQSSEVASDYDASRFTNRVGRFFHSRQAKALAKCLDRIAPLNRVVDLPTGTGRMLPVIAECADAIIACDVSDAMMAEARKRVGPQEKVEFLHCDARSIPLPVGSVDCVVSVRFFMHLAGEQQLEILKEFARITRRWVIVEFGCDSAWHRFRRSIRSIVLSLLHRRRAYPGRSSAGEIRQAARAASLEVRGFFWTLRGLSESAFVLMEKSGSLASGAGSNGPGDK
jgi:ubiquinone/menaquinone biosynthesis C-methylase UbiE